MGNVTLVHLTDIHAQLRPVLFREPSTNLGVGEARGQVPHVTGRAYLDLYGIPGGSPLAYALTPEDYVALARSYGRGVPRPHRHGARRDPRRARRQGAVPRWRRHLAEQLHLDGEQGPGHGRLHGAAEARRHDRPLEFTLGTERVKEIVDGLGCPFLGQNVRDAEWNEPAFESTKMFERGGAKVAVIGQGLPLHAHRQPALDDPELVLRHP